MNPTRGYHISFSGVDGAGKSTQAQLLVKSLCNRGYPCCLHDQYNRTFCALTEEKLGKNLSIREVYSTETAEVLMACDELLHYHNHVLSLLEKGITVVSSRSIIDRYLKAKLYNASNTQDIHTLCSFLPEPALHFYLKVDLVQSLQRISQRGIDTEDEEVIKRYIDIADQEAYANNWIVLDGNCSIASIHRKIKTIVQNRLVW